MQGQIYSTGACQIIAFKYTGNEKSMDKANDDLFCLSIDNLFNVLKFYSRKTTRSCQAGQVTGHNITKTSLCNEYPFTPHFCIVKLGCTRVYIFSYFCFKT